MFGRIAAIETKGFNTLFHFNHYNHAYSPVTHLHMSIHVTHMLYVSPTSSRTITKPTPRHWNHIVLYTYRDTHVSSVYYVTRSRGFLWASDDSTEAPMTRPIKRFLRGRSQLSGIKRKRVSSTVRQLMGIAINLNSFFARLSFTCKL